MKLNKIILFFTLSLIACVSLRFYSLNYTIEQKTGFFTLSSGIYGKILLLLIIIFCIATSLFALLVYKKPENPPKKNIALNIISILCAAAVLVENYHYVSNESLITWQSLLLKYISAGAITYLLGYGVTGFFKKEMPPITSIIMPIYFIVRLICDFSIISKLALISDNILLLTAFCFLLLFMLNFAKLYNNSNTETNFKHLLSTGLGGACLCFTISIPHLVFNFLNEFNYLHISIYSSISLLLLGIFIVTFLISYYNEKNYN